MIQEITTPDAPAAIGPYSQGVKAGGFFFFSGQIPLDPKSGEVVSGGVEKQAERVLENIGSVLSAAGLGFECVVKTTIYMTDLNDFSLVNEIYGKYFQNVKPARATVQVAALPKGASIEIEGVALAG